VMSSSEMKTRSRGRSALDRDGTSLQGVPGPRVRRNLTRGGDRPPSDAEPHPRGLPALERGGVLPVRHRAPREKRSSARGWLCRLFGGPWARGFILRIFLGSFAFVFYESKRGFPSCLGDPSWLSPTVAPEHLWVYPLGSRRCCRLLMGRSSPLVAGAIPWGRASGPRV
jgi:hypothetical protein